MVLLPTVVDCTHVVGRIMFVWGAKHLSRFSGVSQAFLPAASTATYQPPEGCFDSDLPATTEVVLALRDVVLALAMAAAPSLN